MSLAFPCERSDRLEVSLCLDGNRLFGWRQSRRYVDEPRVVVHHLWTTVWTERISQWTPCGHQSPVSAGGLLVRP